MYALVVNNKPVVEFLVKLKGSFVNHYGDFIINNNHTITNQVIT